MNYYQILKIKQGASKEQIKRAYRRVAMLSHPDRTDDKAAHKHFMDATIAYNALIAGKSSPQPTRRAQPPQKKKTAKEKYWDVNEPPKNKSEYKEWYKIKQEKASYYSKLRYDRLKKESEAFRKTNDYWYYLIVDGAMSLFLIFLACAAVIVPWYFVYTYQPEPNKPYDRSSHITMAIMTSLIGTALIGLAANSYVVKEIRLWWKRRQVKTK